MTNYDEKLIATYIADSISIAEVLRKLNLDPRGSNYKMIHQIVRNLHLDTSHFLGHAHLLGKKWISRPWSDVLVENSDYTISSDTKRRMIRDGILINECYVCHISAWLGQPLSLQLDHINGNNTDNRVENLRLLCPNCHSLTPTFCGKNITQKPKVSKKQNQCVCGKLKGIHNKLCASCYQQHKRQHLTKIKWPEIQELVQMVQTMGYYPTAKKLGVSDNAVRKRVKSRAGALSAI